jgi:CheY-like chemotaxis protein
MLVEDNPLNREMLCDWLEVEGYEVATASTVADAYVAAQRGRPQAILLDVALGEENGLDLVARVRRDPVLCHLPVIAVTAHAMNHERETVLAAGCNALVAKPVNFALLKQELETWLRGVPVSEPVAEKEPCA